MDKGNTAQKHSLKGRKPVTWMFCRTIDATAQTVPKKQKRQRIFHWLYRLTWSGHGRISYPEVPAGAI